MASAVPYDPDDFENNNPFAEPELHEPDAIDDEAEHAEEADTPQEPAGETPQDDGQLLKEELVRLLPERFSGKHSLKLVLRAVEKNKPGNPVLRFDATVHGLPKYRQAAYKDIRRTYAEVVKFNNYLVILNLEVFVPVIALPQTSYPAGGDDENKQLMFVWQEWMDRVTGNPILVRDEEFVYFVENDFGYAVINSGRKQLVALGFVRKTLKQLAVPYDPYTELAEFRPQIKAAYLLGQRLHKAMARNQKNEKQLAAYLAELGTKLKGLAQFETVHPGMRNMWDKLGKVTQIELELALVRLISDMGSLGDGTQAMVNDFYEIKEALTNRHLIIRELLQAQAQTQAKHAQAAKIKSRLLLDPIKVEEALRSLEYATHAEENLHMQVRRISAEMIYEKKEVVDFVERKFRRMAKLFALGRVEQHRRLLKHLENIRLDVRIVDENGGLSRLNRDNLTQMKHNLSQSQAAAGDSWTSRTFRSLAAEQAEREERPRGEDKVDAVAAALVLGVATF